MKKILRLVYVLLAVCLLFSVIPASIVSASENKYKTEAQVKTNLSNTLSNYKDGKIWNGSFNGGSQCYGFGKLVIYNVFGKTAEGKYRTWNYAGTSMTGMRRVTNVAKCTKDSIEKLLKQAKRGDVLQFAEKVAGSGKGQHTMIIYSVDSDFKGAKIYECNMYGANKITLRHYTSSELAKVQSNGNRGSLSLLRASNYECTVKLNVNGGSSVTNNKRTAICGTALKDFFPDKTLPTTKKTGYTFAGWYTSKSGGDKVTATTVIKKPQTLYAHWTANKYTVTFMDGKTKVATMQETYDSNYKLPSIPTKSGYTFAFWVGDNGKVTSSTVVKITGPITLNAKWTLNTPTNITVTNPNLFPTHGIKVEWKKNPAATYYYIEYSTKKDFSSGTTRVKVSGSSTSKKITGLKKGTTYYVRVYAVNNSYMSAASATKTIKVEK